MWRGAEARFGYGTQRKYKINRFVLINNNVLDLIFGLCSKTTFITSNSEVKCKFVEAWTATIDYY